MHRAFEQLVSAGRAARPIIRWSCCALYAALVAMASLLSSSSFPVVDVPLPHVDKVVHFVMYGILSASLYWAAVPYLGRRWVVGCVVVSCTLYGFALEVLQGSLPSLGRTFSIWDLAANVAGIVTAAFVCVRCANPSGVAQQTGGCREG